MGDEALQSLPQLVVIGSSAGGIEALSTLVSTLPTPFPAPLVIAQHLDPSRPSHLGEILARRAPIPVVTVQQHEQLVPGTIYVVPSNYNIAVTDHDISLLPDGMGRPKPSIDLLLSSAAEVYGERLIAVILTGTGSDGTSGARAVKLAGGTVVVQNPNTAAFPGMPQALEPQTIDIVADLPRIGAILFDLLTGVAVPTQADAERELEPFLDMVREHTSIDFRSYKAPTILRRLQRRIIAVGTSDLAGYTRYLEQHPDEYQRLASSFLIKVTDFMRDPELFDMLRDRIIPDLIATSRERRRGQNGYELRFWSAGCATGEEAYSLAILVLEALGEQLSSFAVKIFATDLDGDAIAFARHGIYPAGALAHVPEDLAARYFTRSSRGYEVKKLVRSIVVFGEHDLGRRAPFPRIDMVLCRNVLIYFTRELQQRALQLFAFSLREGGYLVLGSTETVSPAPNFFAPELAKLKIYRRHGKERPTGPFHVQGYPPTSAFGASSGFSAQAMPSIPRGERHLQGRNERRSEVEAARELWQAQQESLQARTFKENLLLNMPIGVVVVDRRYNIHEINSTARRLLGIHTVAIGEDLLHLAQNVPTRILRGAIDRAIREKRVTKLNDVQIPQILTGEPAYLQIDCYPQPEAQPEAQSGERGVGSDGKEEKEGTSTRDRPVQSVILLIADVTEAVQSRLEMEQGNIRLSVLSEELRVANASLAANNEETRRANAELEADHLKAEGVAERHAKQVEMLTEANNELLAANEEVTKANSVLRATLDDMLVTNEEAQAAIEEVETLNEEMQATNEELETLNEEMQATVEELNTSNADLAARGDELHSLATSLEVQKAQLEAILSGLADAVLVITPEGRPLLMNEAYKRLFGTGSGKGEGGANDGLDLGNHEDAQTPVMTDERAHRLSPADTPQARAASGETFNMTFTLGSRPGEDRRWLEAIGQPVRGEDGQKLGVVVVRDITDRSLRIMQEQFTSLASHELRTPLTSIKGYLQLLDKSLKERGSERELRFMEILLSQTDRQTRLIEDLLDVARLQSGKFSLQRRRLRLDTLLERVIETEQILAKGPKIELNIDSSVTDRGASASGAEDRDGRGVGSLLVNGDAARLEQAISNLLRNAITYAPESARIDVRLCRLDGSATSKASAARGAMAEINVQDYGRGIAEKDMAGLFTRFYQVSRSDAPPTRGLGLGLYITRQIVEAHGGTISVESTEGEGTTFTIRLPLLEKSANS